MTHISFEGQVAIVTGAGGGLGRSHAMSLAARGARVVVNDVGCADANEESAAERVVREIVAGGGAAEANHADVTDATAVAQMISSTMERWGRIDVLINNAGILRDKSFAKMDVSDFRKVLDVHLMGAMYCSQAVWPHMVEQNYGRVLLTTSASGIYGNFGQANYGAAKSALVGLMNVLAIEGERKGIRVNSLAPTAATRMTEELFGEDSLATMSPETVSPGALFLVCEEAPTKTILGAGGGVFAVSQMVEGPGIYLPQENQTPEHVAAQWHTISGLEDFSITGSAFDQTARYLSMSRTAEEGS